MGICGAYHSWVMAVGVVFTLTIKWCCKTRFPQAGPRQAGWSHCMPLVHLCSGSGLIAFINPLHHPVPPQNSWERWRQGNTKQACPSCMGVVKKMRWKERWEELRSPWRVLTLYKNNGQSQRGEIWWGQRRQVSKMKAVIEYGEVVAEVIRAQ